MNPAPKKSLIEMAESIMVDILIMDVDLTAEIQRDLDGEGCDEGCGLCSPNHPEVICAWHGKFKHATCQIPRRFA